MLERILKIIMIFGEVVGIVILIISFFDLRKLNREHNKVSNSIYLLDNEKAKQKKIITNLIFAILILVVSSIITLILLCIR